jgi:phosphoenolpyruvate carboxykinase (ATP)
MLGEKMARHKTKVYLINTGWTGGPYGQGHRIDINHTRQMVNAALSGELEKGHFHHDELFHLDIPMKCPGVPSEILFPKNTWHNKNDYNKQAKKLAGKFSEAFDKAYGKKNIRQEVVSQCPGK